MSKPLEVISDLAALARQGFTATDIKEIMASNVEAPKPSEGVPETEPKESPQPEAQKEAEPKPEEPDYKKMFEESEAAKKKLEADLLKAQTLNTSKPLTDVPTPTDQEKVNNLLKDLL